jgi:hypothetical protein
MSSGSRFPFLFVSFCTELAYELAGGDGVWREGDQLAGMT